MNVGIIGKIKSVAILDFITYDSLLFHPNENLNIIIGANGTGKSTIVAAIVIGMGGNCKLLSRSPNIADYIKNGKETAQIEIEIYKNDDRSTITFKRSFSSSKQTFEVDGIKVTHKEYLKQVNQFNIQIDNLCQFLPQDRVQDFAKLNSKELLVSTQNSVCSSEVSEIFGKLIEMRQCQKNSNKDLSDNMIKLKDASERIEKLKKIIDNMQTRNDLLSELNNYKRKKIWVEYDSLKAEYNEIQSDLHTAKRSLEDNLESIAPLIERQKVLLKKKLKFENLIKVEMEDSRKYSTELKDLEKKTERLEEMVNDARGDLRDAITSAQEQDNEIKTAERMLNAFHQDLNDAQNNSINEEEMRIEIKKNTDNYNLYRKKVDDALQKRDSINHKLELDFNPEIISMQKKISFIENIPLVRLRMIERKFADTYQGIMWLRKNINQFQSRIYETVLLEVNLKDSKYAKYFENSVGIRDLISFICEDYRDSSKLMNILREELQLGNINVAANSSTTVPSPSIPLSEIRQFGFEAYLIDVIEGPAPVLNQLCQLFQIHNIPIGNDKTYDLADKIPPEIKKFFSTNHKFSVSISRYTGNKSTSIIEITKKDLMNAIDNKALQTEKTKLASLLNKSDHIKNTRLQLENFIAETTIQMNECKDNNKRLIANKNIIEQCQEKIKRQLKRVKDLKDNIIDIANEKIEFKRKITLIITNLLKLQQTKIQIFEQYQKSCIELELNKEKLTIFNQINADTENEIKEAERSVANAKNLVNNISDALARKKEQCKKKEALARNLTNGKSPSDTDFPFKQIFTQMPNDIVDIDIAMNEVQSRIECMGVEEEININDYEEKVKQVEEMRLAIANFNDNNTQLEEKMLELHNQWFPIIINIVEDINTYFSQFMSSMGYAGEVELITSAANEYSDYGIEIRVKYRDQEKIQTLDRYVQSGGERAVAIAVYTLSLQHISHVPFRCVDEINQGMDRNNERKVFEMIVKETCVVGKSQYFFITPKLLPNLVWNDLMAVHIVHTGGFLSERLRISRN